ncbi:hypothetical protein DPMN_036400 [Dreissena polymorpha]|uniref:Uncharacterized protein n=1 Tax=Dreissena polymorpha TaxID=45954 RepID=A0A9D4MAM1_DREPO|nr:hypothetical protein DPMN_036400 [Dreissena polymorpha]
MTMTTSTKNKIDDVGIEDCDDDADYYDDEVNDDDDDDVVIGGGGGGIHNLEQVFLTPRKIYYLHTLSSFSSHIYSCGNSP